MKRYIIILIAALFSGISAKAQLVSETRDSLMKLIVYMEERLPM